MKNKYDTICKRCGKPIGNGEVYIEQIGHLMGPWHCWNCTNIPPKR